MTGSLIALAAKGAQDTHLSYKPSMTYWKASYQRHTNFSQELLQGLMNGQIRTGGKLVHTFQRNSDLISRAYLVFDFNKLVDNRGGAATGNLFVGSNYYDTAANAAAAGDLRTNPVFDIGDGIRFVDAAGFLAINEIRLLIGGAEFDRYNGYCALMEYNSVTPSRRDPGEIVGIYASDSDAIAAHQQYFLSGANRFPVAPSTAPTETVRFYVPLYFWFSRLIRNKAIPQIALQYHQVTIELRIAQANELVKFVYNQVTAGGVTRNILTDAASNVNAITNPSNWSGGELVDCFIMYDGTFLDTRERKAFSCKSLEYLILQHQYQETSLTAGQSSYNITVNFNHPCTHLDYFLRRPIAGQLSNWTDWTGVMNPLTSIYNTNIRAIDVQGPDMPAINSSTTILFNNQSLQRPVHPRWYRLVDPKDHGAYSHDYFFYTIPFSLDLGEQESASDHTRMDVNPSGSYNLSRIDSVILQLTADGLADSNAVFAEGAWATTTGALTCFVMVQNYNQMKVAAGMAGLTFAS